MLQIKKSSRRLWFTREVPVRRHDVPGSDWNCQRGSANSDCAVRRESRRSFDNPYHADHDGEDDVRWVGLLRKSRLHRILAS